ncbi:MAG: HlyD family efflux transporter periplasmic adaptor subunit [Rhodobacteraceae bacterium]|nr:HlyD family efflux transporter periplasmic adaptor subunit [Paracoccaceae bacterium]
MARRMIYVLAALVLAALALVAFRPEPAAVEVAQAGPASIVTTVEAEGVARIREVFAVSAPIAGRMERIALRPGDEVVADRTVVATILPMQPALLDARARAVAEAARDAAAAAVDLARIQLAQAEAQSAYLTAEADRADTLRRRGAIPEQAYQKARLDATAGIAAVASAEANLAVRERELASAAAALTTAAPGDADRECCTEIRAPVSGRVLRVLTDDAQVVQPGTPIVEIGNPADIEIEVRLLSRDAVQVAPGARAEIDGWGGPVLPARVERIDPSAETRVSALGIEEQRVNVILAPEGEPGARRGLGHGFRVVGRIVLWEGRVPVAVPVGALFRQGADWMVWTVQDGRARAAKVTVGHRDAARAEITGGIGAGTTVILHPGDAIAEGVRVAPQAGESG